MYEQFYNLSAEPFRLSPDHDFAYAHKGYRKARAYMAYAFQRAEGFVMITGRPGTGKTTLVGTLLEEMAGKSVNIANLVCSQLQADDLLKLVAYDFGVPVSVVEKGELLQRLTQQFKSWRREGRRALLIVDEAQDLSVSAMEELRLLTNIQVDSRPLLQIFLLGQPELRELVLSPPMEQVHQRIIAASHLQPLASDETEAYIRHRLNVVRWRGDPAISKAVYPLVYKFSEGVPRRINLICSRLLLHCAVEGKHQVAVKDVREVVQELQEENLASGDKFSESDFQVTDVFDARVNTVNTSGDGASPAEQEMLAGNGQTPAARVRHEKAPSADRQGPRASGQALKGNNRADATGRQGVSGSGRGKAMSGAARAMPLGARPGSAPADKRPLQAGVVPHNTPRQRLAAPNLAAMPSKNPRPKSLKPQSPDTSARADDNKTDTSIQQKQQTESVKPAVNPRDKGNEPTEVRKSEIAGEVRGRHHSATWPTIVILLVIFLLVTWTLPGFDIGLFPDTQ